MTEEDFSKKEKKKKNILFKRSFDDSIEGRKILKEEIADDDERVLKEIDIMTGCGVKIKMKKAAARMPTIDEAMSFLLAR
jgi:hypothetical protein